jgi:Na+-transporting NADH:ubiquinone oxidoreductase subunit A
LWSPPEGAAVIRSHRIMRGFDLPLQGAPTRVLPPCAEPELVGVTTEDHAGTRWTLLVREHETVTAGQPVLANRGYRDIVLVSPVAGRVRSVIYGERRSPVCVEIERGDGPTHAVLVPMSDRDGLATALQKSGLWPLLRQRPLGRMARPDRSPDAIFINGMDTEPLAADPAVLVQTADGDLPAGLEVLRRLSGGPMYLTLRAGVRHPSALASARHVEVHEFSGPHPSGLPGTHIDRIRPLREGELYWTVRAQDVARIGAWAASGRFPVHRTIAVSGPAAFAAGYRRVHEGARIGDVVGKVARGVRVIEGTVLGGAVRAPETAFVGVTTHTLTLLSDGAGRRVPLGWLLPRLDRFSMARASLGWLRPRRAYDADARLHGGVRAMIDFGLFAKVMPLELHLPSLIRAIEAGDLDEAVALGLLDVTEEDVALCTVVDPCKVEFGALIRRGLDLYAAEHGAA